MAGIQYDQIGVVGQFGGRVAQRRQNVGHARRIVDVHLTAEGLDVQFTRHRELSIVPESNCARSFAVIVQRNAEQLQPVPHQFETKFFGDFVL